VDVFRCGRGRSSSSKGHNWAEKMPLLDSLTNTPSIARANYEFMAEGRSFLVNCSVITVRSSFLSEVDEDEDEIVQTV
jgi:hypothetical protein